MINCVNVTHATRQMHLAENFIQNDNAQVVEKSSKVDKTKE